MIPKSIVDYFDNAVEYPHEMAHNPIPYGTLWMDGSANFLNAFINHTIPIAWFVLDRYSAGGAQIEDITVFRSDDDGRFQYSGTKRELIESILNGELKSVHTNLRCFCDDVVIIAKIETEVEDGLGRYMFYWFDCDVSDCWIGKFETTDSDVEVVQSIRTWLRKDVGEEITYTEMPISFLRGWIQF